MALKYPAIPEPTTDPQSLRDSILSVKQMLEILTGQRGNANNAAVLPQDIASLASSSDVETSVAALQASIDANTAAIAAATTALTAQLPVGQCKLIYVSTTQIKLIPFNGTYLKINGVLYAIPSAGVTISNSSLSASTIYYVYAYMNSGTMTLELSTTTHATDSTTGAEIKSGDATRTLVGMIRTDIGTNFADTTNARWVRSWFNDDGVVGYQSSSTTVSTSSLSMIELETAMRVYALLWDREFVTQDIHVSLYNNGAGNGMYTGCGTSAADLGLSAIIAQITASYHYNASATYTTLNSGDQMVTWTVWGAVGGGIGFWTYKSNTVRTQRR
jgi:hypothetical protein